MEEHKMLWDGNVNASDGPLRRPHGPPETNAVNTSNNQNLQDSRQDLDLSSSFNNSVNLEDDILSKSKLSVHAEEWFPPNYNRKNTPTLPNPPTKSVQNRLQKYKSQPEKQFNEDHSATLSTNIENGLVYDEASQDLSKLQEIISTLINDPGQFDDLFGSFVETLGPYYEDVNVISNTTELIVNQAIREPNFQYNAARLCSVIEEQCPLFRSTLYLLCKKKVEENKYDSNLALFLAEVYTQFHSDHLYGQLLIQTLQGVLSLGDGHNVKSVCQVLKLTGAALELNHKQAIDDIFQQLKVAQDMQLSHIKSLIESVITLRASSWGQSQNSPVTTNNRYQNQDLHVSNDGPIFYGPDGKELTEEERQFLTDNCFYQADCPYDDSDPDGLWEPDPEMDEEMQAAFRQFVQLSKQ